MTALLDGPRGPQIRRSRIRSRNWSSARRALEEQQLKNNSNDVNALYCRGVTRAQFAVYTGLVERAWFSALRNAVAPGTIMSGFLNWIPPTQTRSLSWVRTTMLSETCRGA